LKLHETTLTRALGRCVIWVMLAFVLCGAGSLDGGNFVVTYTHMSEPEARDLFERARDGYAAVTKYLGRAPSQKVIVRDLPETDKGFGRTMIAVLEGKTEAVRPIEIHIPLRYLRTKPFKTALVHELTHAIAGVSHEHNLFLAEGLAVHVGGMFARPDESDSFATYRIHDVAKQFLRRITVLDPIQHVYRERELFADRERDFASGYTSALAYAFAGSFVTYLIQRDGPAREADGLAKFLTVYADGDFQKAYGQPLATLERQWISFLNANPKVRY
jgi:hypothetical protein